MVGSAIGMGRVALGTGLVLMVPLIAMRFTDEVQWSAFDFAFMGALVFGTGLAYQLVARRAGTVAYRLALGIALAGAFLLVWVNAAVGIIGEPGGPNLMYAAVLAVGLVGALAVRFRAGAMARPLYAMAIAQMLVPVIALVVARSELVSQPPGIYGVFVLNTCFALMFVASAMLFRRAGAVAAG